MRKNKHFEEFSEAAQVKKVVQFIRAASIILIWNVQGTDIIISEA